MRSAEPLLLVGSVAPSGIGDRRVGRGNEAVVDTYQDRGRRDGTGMRVMIISSSHTLGQSESAVLSSGVARVKLSTS